MYAQWVNAVALTLGLPVGRGGFAPKQPATGLGFYGPKVVQEQNVTSEDWLTDGIWAIAVSTNVTAFRYDATRRQLTVAFATKGFKNTRIYRYDRVDRSTAEAMFRAPSLGRFVHRRLKGQFPHQGPLSPSQV